MADKKNSNLVNSIGSFFNENVDKKLSAYMPSELVGGSIPAIVGLEDESVWNAAAQACGTERVHYCYTLSEGRCWYLATPSSSLASNPDSWCPLATALPGNSEFIDKQTVYIYEQEGTAGALRWDNETGRLQVFIGASRTILPRLQSMDANFISLNPETATPFMWKNRALHQEKLSRILTRALLVSGLGVTLAALLFWAGSYLMASIVSPRLDDARKLSTQAANDLMIAAANAMQNNTSLHLARLQELLDTLTDFGGVLLRYEIKPDGRLEWEALIPAAVQGNAPRLKATAVGMENGRVRIKGSQ